MEKSLKEIVIEKFGSVNAFIATKTKEFNNELPISREAIYKIVTHETNNPGIKSLTIIADMVGIPRDQVYKEYLE